MTKNKTVHQLAQEANIDDDAALVALWDAGFDNILESKDVIYKKGDLNRARRALGMATRREIQTFVWWMNLLELEQKELSDLLCNLGVSGQKNKKLNSKTVARLKKYARDLGIDPVTGSKYLSSETPKTIKPSTFNWPIVGHTKELRFLTVDEVCSIHSELVNDFSNSTDPISPAGARSDQLINSAVFRPHTSLNGTFKYPTVEMAAAALLHSLILNHPFHNGNKRTALVSTLVFLDENGLFPEFNDHESFKLVLKIAQHRIIGSTQDNLSDREVIAVAEWLHKYCRVVEMGERPLCYRKLSRILCTYGCTLTQVPGGSKVSISREVTRRGSWGKTKTETLPCQVTYGGEGREVSKKVIKRVREALELDEKHGVDSHSFYDSQPSEVSDFIARYRKTLDRLAKY